MNGTNSSNFNYSSTVITLVYFKIIIFCDPLQIIIFKGTWTLWFLDSPNKKTGKISSQKYLYFKSYYQIKQAILTQGGTKTWSSTPFQNVHLYQPGLQISLSPANPT